MNVAFEEIPQRELRGSYGRIYMRAENQYVAFEEIPQRELRDVFKVFVADSQILCRVAFEEIPQRELRV